MDESTAALRVKESRKVLELILGVKRRGLPIALISHNMPHVFEVSDRIRIHRDEPSPQEGLYFRPGWQGKIGRIYAGRGPPGPSGSFVISSAGDSFAARVGSDPSREKVGSQYLSFRHSGLRRFVSAIAGSS